MNVPQSRLRRALPASLIGAALIAAGCGSTIDADQMEQDIIEDFVRGTDFQRDQLAVDCPDDESADEGNEFDCILTAPNGDEVTVNVTITEGGDAFEAVVPPQQPE
jgi:hypothetical protein